MSEGVVEPRRVRTGGMQLCKECNRNPRANGSSRCTNCSVAYKNQRLEEDALQRKINKQNGKAN